MKKVKMLVSMAGASESYVPGDVITVRDDIAEAWELAGIAEIEADVKPKGGKANAD